jgi:hypothetical protein
MPVCLIGSSRQLRRRAVRLVSRHCWMRRVCQVSVNSHIRGPAIVTPFRPRPHRSYCAPDLSAWRADVSADALAFNAAPWQRFHLRPEPQGHGSLRPRLASALA